MGIKDVEKQVADVSEIFRDLAVMVSEQGHMLDDIEEGLVGATDPETLRVLLREGIPCFDMHTDLPSQTEWAWGAQPASPLARVQAVPAGRSSVPAPCPRRDRLGVLPLARPA